MFQKQEQHDATELEQENEHNTASAHDISGYAN